MRRRPTIAGTVAQGHEQKIGRVTFTVEAKPQYADPLLQGRRLFGSDCPPTGSGCRIKDFDEVGFEGRLSGR